MSSANDVDTHLDELFAANRSDEALALIERLSSTGDPAACRWRGILLLGGEYYGRDIVAARHWLGLAADARDTNALWLEIALCANGTGGVVDWASALEKLGRLAETEGDALSQIEHIGSLDLDAAGFPTEKPAIRLLCPDPAIRWIPNFCSEFESRQIVASGADLLSPSVVYDPVTGDRRSDPVRTSLAASIGPARENIVVAAVLRRIASVSNTPLANGESLSLLRYADGQEYRPHLDSITNATNQRATTAILYLNDGYEGGETVFPAIGLTVIPRAGALLLFDNLLVDGAPDRRTLHAGRPVRSGAKWIATRWIRRDGHDPWGKLP